MIFEAVNFYRNRGEGGSKDCGKQFQRKRRRQELLQKLMVLTFVNLSVRPSILPTFWFCCHKWTPKSRDSVKKKKKSNKGRSSRVTLSLEIEEENNYKGKTITEDQMDGTKNTSSGSRGLVYSGQWFNHFRYQNDAMCLQLYEEPLLILEKTTTNVRLLSERVFVPTLTSSPCYCLAISMYDCISVNKVIGYMLTYKHWI